MCYWTERKLILVLAPESKSNQPYNATFTFSPHMTNFKTRGGNVSKKIHQAQSINCHIPYISLITLVNINFTHLTRQILQFIQSERKTDVELWKHLNTLLNLCPMLLYIF